MSATRSGDPTRRRKQFGSIRRLPSGRYQASYWHEGRRHVGPVAFLLKGDARSWLSEVETDIRRGAWIDPSMGRASVESVARDWLDGDPGKRRRSRRRDEEILRLHVFPEIGAAPVGSVTKARVQRLVNEWVAEGRAPRTVERQFAVVRALFNYALENDMVARTPCRGIRLPERRPVRREPVTPETAERLVAEVGPQYGAMVWLGAVMGLRWGEVAGLRVGDLDLLSGSMRVDLQLDDRRELVEVKSNSSRRTLSVPAPLVEVLAAHIAGLGATGADRGALLFRSPNGGPLSYTNWRRRVWLPAAARAGVPGCGFHDLRRAASTALVQSGVDVKTAQARLGHADVRLTLEVYAQATSEADRLAAERLGHHFFESRTQRAQRSAP